MIAALDYYRELNFASVVLRTCLAMIFGGMIGLERSRKGRAAGFRTYMLVCLGACLTMLLGQYFQEMAGSHWQPYFDKLGVEADITRIGAQVISGIGFLGAGSILIIGRKKILGLTTAAGLWASGCLGLAIGAAFYEAVIIFVILMLLSIRLFPIIEEKLTERSRYLNLYIELEDIDQLKTIIAKIKELNATILDVEVHRQKRGSNENPNATIALYLKSGMLHSEFISEVGMFDAVLQIDEI